MNATHMTDEEFLEKLKKESRFEHSGTQKDILWGRLSSYLDEEKVGRGFWHFGFRYAYLSVLALTVLLGSAGVTFASQSSIPGQTLYPVKRFSEEAVIFVKFDQREKDIARMELTTKRADEVNKLVADNPEKVGEALDEYESQIESYLFAYMEDPEYFQSFEMTIMANKEYLMKAAESAPDEIKIRIKALLEESEFQETDDGKGDVEGEEDKLPDGEESGDNGSDSGANQNETSN